MDDDLEDAEGSEIENLRATVHTPMLWPGHCLLLNHVFPKFWPSSPWLLCCVISSDWEKWNYNKTVLITDWSFYSSVTVQRPLIAN